MVVSGGRFILQEKEVSKRTNLELGLTVVSGYQRANEDHDVRRRNGFQLFSEDLSSSHFLYGKIHQQHHHFLGFGPLDLFCPGMATLFCLVFLCCLQTAPSCHGILLSNTLSTNKVQHFSTIN